MDIASQVEVDNELRSLGSEQLRHEKLDLSKQLKALQDQIGDLAFNNYRTYADAGRTTQDCTEIFTEMSDKLREVTSEVSTLQSELRTFHSNSKSIGSELATLKSACDKSSPLWEVMSLPARMDVCIRSGYYEAAYSLTNYGMMMQQHSMVKNPLMKTIADRLVEARSLLLEELFNKFAGPLDLAASLQVVNNVRKMPYLTPTQLRVSILQHKDMYLEKQLLDIASHPDFALAAIDIYRTCMHDTLVLYLSVFPENETVKKDPTVDPRWEQWPTSAPSAVLGHWASRNISRLLDLIHRTEMKSGVDMASVWSKLMSVASTFGRMGLDFRPLIVHSLTGLVLERFRTAVRQATNRLVNDVKVLSVASGEITQLPGENDGVQHGAAPLPSAEISMWDDICVYGNDILNALNGMRYSHTPMLVAGVVSVLHDSLLSVLSWLSSFHQSASFTRAVRILCLHLAPFLSQSIRHLFPYSVVSRLFGSSITRQQYDQFTELEARDLSASCDGSDRIQEVLLPLLQKKTLADIDMSQVLRKDHKENSYNNVFDAKPDDERQIEQEVHVVVHETALESPSPHPSVSTAPGSVTSPILLHQDHPVLSPAISPVSVRSPAPVTPAGDDHVESHEQASPAHLHGKTENVETPHDIENHPIQFYDPDTVVPDVEFVPMLHHDAHRSTNTSADLIVPTPSTAVDSEPTSPPAIWASDYTDDGEHLPDMLFPSNLSTVPEVTERDISTTRSELSAMPSEQYSNDLPSDSEMFPPAVHISADPSAPIYSTRAVSSSESFAESSMKTDEPLSEVGSMMADDSLPLVGSPAVLQLDDAQPGSTADDAWDEEEGEWGWGEDQEGEKEEETAPAPTAKGGKDD